MRRIPIVCGALSLALMLVAASGKKPSPDTATVTGMAVAGPRLADSAPAQVARTASPAQQPVSETPRVVEAAGQNDRRWRSRAFDALRSLAREGAGAFIGGFAGFVFVQIGRLVESRYARKQRHHTRLVKLEYFLNETLGALNDNAYCIKNYRQHVTRGAAHFSFPKPLRIDHDAFADLLDKVLINELLSLGDSLRKVNDDRDALIDGYHKVLGAYVSGAMSQAQYVGSAASLADGIEMLGRAYGIVFEEVELVLSRVRARAPKDVPRPWGLVANPTIASVTDAEVKAERAKLASEIEETRKRSAEKISRLTGESGQSG